MAYPPSVVGSVASFQEPPAKGAPIGDAPAVGLAEVVKVDVAEPDVAEPDVAQPDVAQPEGAQPAALLTLSDGSKFSVDPSDRRFPVWSRFLTDQVGSQKPLYVETDPAGKWATRVLPPRDLRIAEIFKDPESPRLVVRAEDSPMPRFLNRDHPKFGNYSELLSAAAASHQKLLLTADPDTGEILDVRQVEGSSEGGAGPGAQGVKSLSEDEAQEAFEFLAGDSEIPFDYLPDCCASRAHEMYRLLSMSDIGCRKIWNYGTAPGFLRIAAPKEPSGHLTWFFHVAPLVRVTRHDGSFTDLVMDPSLFDKPATVDEWLALQDGLAAIHQVDSPEIFHRTLDGKSEERDDTFVKERDILRQHRYYRDLRRLKP